MVSDECAQRMNSLLCNNLWVVRHQQPIYINGKIEHQFLTIEGYSHFNLYYYFKGRKLFLCVWYGGVVYTYIYIYIYTFSTIIAIIRACACWALFVVTLTNTVHLIYIYIYILFYCTRVLVWQAVHLWLENYSACLYGQTEKWTAM